MQARSFARPRPARRQQHAAREASGTGRTGNLERTAWLFTRISAVILLVMAVFHLLYMHIVMGMDAISFQLIAWRWQSPGWRLFDLCLLVFGWLHGANGMRIVIDDYVHSPVGRIVARTLLFAVTATLIVLGVFVIFTFKSP
jgi:succinate dehydrogenase / fumarate reductase membrane anchor subunit